MEENGYFIWFHLTGELNAREKAVWDEAEKMGRRGRESLITKQWGASEGL